MLAEWSAESSGLRSTSDQGCPPCRPTLNPIPPTLRNRQTQDFRDPRCDDGTPLPIPIENDSTDWSLWQPGVADPGIESLVDEKVDAFWKGVDGGASKSGQIIVTFSEKRPKKSTWFQVYAGEVRLSSHPSVPQLLITVFTGGDSMGTMVLWSPRVAHRISNVHRVISAEIRQPKSNQGMRRLC